MQKYPEETKKSIIARMLPPNNEAIPRLAEETGVPKDTLYCWRIKHRRANKSGNAEAEMPSTLSSEERFQVVLESAAMNELELGEYCRGKGVYPQQIQQWRQACADANGTAVPVDRDQLRTLRKENRILNAELDRKEKALAEAAALLVLQKKVRAIWGEPEDVKSAYKSDAW